MYIDGRKTSFTFTSPQLDSLFSVTSIFRNIVWRVAKTWQRVSSHEKQRVLQAIVVCTLFGAYKLSTINQSSSCLLFNIKTAVLAIHYLLKGFTASWYPSSIHWYLRETWLWWLLKMDEHWKEGLNLRYSRNLVFHNHVFANDLAT